MYNVGDIITFEGKKVIILTTIEDNMLKYLFVNVLTEDEQNNTEDFYLLNIKPDNTLERLIDENEVNRLFPKIQEGLLQSMSEVGIDPAELPQQ